MKLDELYKPKIGKKLSKVAFDYFPKHYDESSESAMFEKLEKMGWHFLSSGYYSYVFMNDKKPYILKINKWF